MDTVDELDELDELDDAAGLKAGIAAAAAACGAGEERRRLFAAGSPCFFGGKRLPRGREPTNGRKSVERTIGATETLLLYAV